MEGLDLSQRSAAFLWVRNGLGLPLDAVFESSDVERFGWIGSWSSRYILLWIAKDQKTAPMRPARAKQARDARSGKRTKLTHVNAFRRFRAQHYVEKLRGSSPATALLRKGTTQ